MKFTFDRDAMIKEIAIAQEIITNKSPVTILSNILIIAENNSLTIQATDSTVKFTTTIPVDIQEEGRTTIYCDKFMSIISSLPSGDIEFIKYENKTLYVKLTGACANCMMQDETLNDNILNALKEEVPEIQEIVKVDL